MPVPAPVTSHVLAPGPCAASHNGESSLLASPYKATDVAFLLGAEILVVPILMPRQVHLLYDSRSEAV
jgi:hypothetical protein